jgi:hypothetical protein
VDITSQTAVPIAAGMSFVLEASGQAGLTQEIWLLNVQTNQLELVDSRQASSVDRATRVELGSGFARFVDANGNLTARLKWKITGPLFSPSWVVRIDQAIWSVRP